MLFTLKIIHKIDSSKVGLLNRYPSLAAVSGNNAVVRVHVCVRALSHPPPKRPTHLCYCDMFSGFAPHPQNPSGNKQTKKNHMMCTGKTAFYLEYQTPAYSSAFHSATKKNKNSSKNNSSAEETGTGLKVSKASENIMIPNNDARIRSAPRARV